MCLEEEERARERERKFIRGAELRRSRLVFFLYNVFLGTEAPAIRERGREGGREGRREGGRVAWKGGMNGESQQASGRQSAGREGEG